MLTNAESYALLAVFSECMRNAAIAARVYWQSSKNVVRKIILSTSSHLLLLTLINIQKILPNLGIKRTFLSAVLLVLGVIKRADKFKHQFIYTWTVNNYTHLSNLFSASRSWP